MFMSKKSHLGDLDRKQNIFIGKLSALSDSEANREYWCIRSCIHLVNTIYVGLYKCRVVCSVVFASRGQNVAEAKQIVNLNPNDINNG